MSTRIRIEKTFEFFVLDRLYAIEVAVRVDDATGEVTMTVDQTNDAPLFAIPLQPTNDPDRS